MNIRQATFIVVAAVMLFLLSCLNTGPADAIPVEAGFELTARSLDSLRKKGVPEEVLNKLESLKDRKIESEDAFLEAVRQKIGRGQTVAYKNLILQASADDFAESNSISKALQSQNAAIQELREQNRALMNRLADLEAPRYGRAPKQGEAGNPEEKELAQRVKELEDAQTVREDATRLIIRDALSSAGSKINESVALGGTLEVAGGWTENFSGRSEGVLTLSTAELDFEIEVNNWARGSLVLQFEDGTNVTFPTTTGFQTGVDRITLDTAFVTIGDPQRFPLSLTAGRIILPFGISTGDPVADVLTIEDPLTIEGFEIRKTAFMIDLGFPTPAVLPATPPVNHPSVRPLVINPLISSLTSALGYTFPPPAAVAPVPPRPASPVFSAGIYAYDGDTFRGAEKNGGFRPENYFGATAGFHLRGNCGVPLDQLRDAVFCPWSLDVDVDYNSSIFESRFLGSEYQGFLGRIGFIDGMAASIKATLGRIGLVGEWNGAIKRAHFADDLNRQLTIKPSAWQVSLGYQFDWNPWVEAVGAQGNYLTVNYSESRDLAGVTRVLEGQSSRVGSIPRRRFIVSAGEWVLDNLRFAIDYSYNWDYSVDEGGTGSSAHGVLSQVTLVW